MMAPKYIGAGIPAGEGKKNSQYDTLFASLLLQNISSLPL